jgi:hypothetical protein
METESQVEFHQRWVKNAEADFAFAHRKWRIWIVAFIAISVAFVASQFMPGPERAKVVVRLLLAIPFAISSVKAAMSASNLRDARKFLTECRKSMKAGFKAVSKK